MREICGFVQFVDSQAFHAVQTPPADDEGAEGTWLVRADNDQMKFAAVRKCHATRLYPRILVHRRVGVLCQELPALRFILDSAEFLDNPY